ncbi:DUF192 domain-containing protein [Clostridium sp. FP1]|uniref:DUF192 domain-containing protein n=1 Tax=Clostridium sp. FP1 TaxID=2724076 RepID=UPI0013E92088|nr:DUF192 domain-containing protein [Clostridium sp. FP1]MBZ9635402.1 DUF192 domain-containing protein [Clostridium sp. FP1]
MIKNLKCNDDKIINVFVADSYTKRLFGYMFREKPHHDAIMLTPCNGIHTFFMKFNIDVLFLNEDMQVIIKIENLRPGQIVAKVMGSKIVIESKAGVFNNIKEGNILNI